MTATFTAYPDEAAWLKARRQLITSSDIPVLLGLLDQVSPFALWLDKTGQGEPRESSYLMRRGHGMEGFIAAEYARETGRFILDPGNYALTVRDWRGATVDRLASDCDSSVFHVSDVVDKDAGVSQKIVEGGDWQLLEIKAPTPYGMHKYSDGPDKYVTAQVQWQMHVTGLAFADVAVDMGTRLDVFRVNANPKLQAALEREAERFRGYVTTDTPPPPDGHPGTARAMAQFFSEPVEETVTLDAGAREWFDRMKVGGDEIGKLEHDVEEAKNEFRRELGQAQRGVASDLSFEVTWRANKNGVRTFRWKEIDA